MDEHSLKILELAREDNMLHIGVRVKGPYDPTVREPKIAVIFGNGKETRRLPIIVQAYFPAETLDSYTFFAKYSYDLRYIFFEKEENQKINFWFEITYGDMVIEHIPYVMSSDVRLEEDELYRVTCETSKHEISYQLIEVLQEEKKRPVVVKVIRSMIGGIWGIFLFLLSILFIPIFLVEGILELLHCVRRIKKNRKRGIIRIINHIRIRINSLMRVNFGISDSKVRIVKFSYKISSMLPIKNNRIVFISNRRKDLSGNFEFVYNILKDDKKLDIRFVLDDRDVKHMSYLNAIKYSFYCATSKVILVDDYIALIYRIPRREGTTMIQLWHACGAFKTFGYSRLGKPGGQKQKSPAHRNYDYAIVSSSEISKFYAEGFGLSLEKTVVTGIPRTDIFFDKSYKEKARSEFYERYPQLKDKKILLFAPTFRGDGKISGHYPIEKFDVVRAYEELGKEYAIVIKHHPFVQNRNEIPEEYQDVIIDLSENSELNDLLFVADLLITDYSSVIFEAALLNIPMLFYAYDLQRYIATRGFYYEYDKFVPGKIVKSFAQTIHAISNQDFEAEKIDKFKERFFDDLDGKSSQRTVELIYNSMENNKKD